MKLSHLFVCKCTIWIVACKNYTIDFLFQRILVALVLNTLTKTGLETAINLMKRTVDSVVMLMSHQPVRM